MAEDDTVMFSSIRPRARPDNVKPSPPFDPTKDDDDDNDKDSTVTYYDTDKDESKTVSVKKEDTIAPLKNTDGETIGAIDLNKNTVDLYSTEEGLFKGLDISFSDKKSSIPMGVLTYEDTPSGKKGLTYKLGKGKIYTDADMDLLNFEKAPFKANLGFVLDFAEGGSLPNSASEQMEEILTEKKDPVSGNTAPLGATTAEVRDDIPIMASPNEFMINAATRRYYGTEFFENLQKAAEQGFKRIKQGEESFFRDDELETDQEPQKLQEGGEVKEVPEPTGGGFGGFGGTGGPFTGFTFETYVHPTKPEFKVVSFNGRPLVLIPDGYTLKEDSSPTQKTSTERSFKDSRRPTRADELIREKRTYRNKDINDWTVKDYKNYSESMSPGEEGQLNFEEVAVVGTIGSLLGLGFAGPAGLSTIIKNQKLNQAKDVYNRTTQLIQANAGTDDILAANKSAFFAMNRLEKQGPLGSIGLDIFDTNTLDTEELEELYKVPVPVAGRTLESTGLTLIEPDAYKKSAAYQNLLKIEQKKLVERGQEADAKVTIGDDFFSKLFGTRNVDRPLAEVAIEGAASIRGVSVEDYVDMSSYERSEALNRHSQGQGAQLNESIRQAGLTRQQFLGMSEDEKNEIMKTNPRLRQDFSRHHLSTGHNFEVT